MGNPSSSSADPICPTFAAGYISLVTGKGSGTSEFNDDSAKPASPNGYTNQCPSTTVGSFNNDWANGDLNQKVQPVTRSGLLSFGFTGLQS